MTQPSRAAISSLAYYSSLKVDLAPAAGAPCQGDQAVGIGGRAGEDRLDGRLVPSGPCGLSSRGREKLVLHRKASPPRCTEDEGGCLRQRFEFSDFSSEEPSRRVARPDRGQVVDLGHLHPRQARTAPLLSPARTGRGREPEDAHQDSATAGGGRVGDADDVPGGTPLASSTSRARTGGSCSCRCARRGLGSIENRRRSGPHPGDLVANQDVDLSCFGLLLPVAGM